MNSSQLLIVVLLSLSLAACGKGETSAASADTGKTAAHGSAEEAHEGEGHEGEEQEGHAGEGGEEHGGAHEEGIKLTAEQIKNANIGVAQAGPANIRERLPLYGVVAPNAERVRDVAARFPGPIRSVNKRIGESVKQGDVLATVESDESLQTYPVVAPLAGVVIARNANPGEQASDKPLFTVADLSTVWVELSLFPRDVSKVRVGQTVRVKSGDANVSADGKVVYVAPVGSSSNQTLTARVLLDNADRKWAPGLYVTAEVTLSSASVPLAISSEALQTLEGQQVVFVQHDEGFEPKPVQLGRSDGEFAEVRSGVEVGATYATRNSFILKAELGKGEAEHEH